MKHSVFLSILLATAVWAEPVFWQENFPQDGELSDHGWTLLEDNGKDVFRAQNGILTMNCHNSPYHGTAYSTPLPLLPARFQFTFQVMVGAGNVGGYDHFSLKMNLGNLLLAFRNPFWAIHRPATNTWEKLANLSNSAWHTCQIRFDTEKNTAEYFLDDLALPVFVDMHSDLRPQPPSLTVANYGLTKGNLTNCLRNLTITALPKSTLAERRLAGTLLYRGVGTDTWPMDRLLQAGGEPCVTCHLELANQPHLDNGNASFQLRPQPSPNPTTLPKCIILADFPANALPDYAVLQLLQAMESGATLVILNGYFTLDRGGFENSPLAPLLPVRWDGCWGDVQPGENATVAANCLAWKAYGKGKVIATLPRRGSPEAAQALLQLLFPSPTQEPAR
ncbi:MAG: hypothetical protein IJJ33_08310 [Victivallales bacterium]|nr:hypothetical protein [Victivallales bacterium]